MPSGATCKRLPSNYSATSTYTHSSIRPNAIISHASCCSFQSACSTLLPPRRGWRSLMIPSLPSGSCFHSRAIWSVNYCSYWKIVWVSSFSTLCLLAITRWLGSCERSARTSLPSRREIIRLRPLPKILPVIVWALSRQSSNSLQLIPLDHLWLAWFVRFTIKWVWNRLKPSPGDFRKQGESISRATLLSLGTPIFSGQAWTLPSSD